MIILMTGASGFIGRHLCQTLSKKGHFIYAVKRPLGSTLHIPHVEWIDWNISLDSHPAYAFADIDCVIHLAQSNQYRNFPEGAPDMMDVNIAGTFNLLEFSRSMGIKNFILASSGGVYGDKFDEDCLEDKPLSSPLSSGFYITTKHMAELLCENYSAFFSTKIMRIFFAYGLDQQPDRLIPRLINNIRNDLPIFFRRQGWFGD